MEYYPVHEMRIIRTTHKIVIRDYGRVCDLIEALRKCPPDAKLIDRNVDDFGNYVLTFQQETELTEGGAAQ